MIHLVYNLAKHFYALAEQDNQLLHIAWVLKFAKLLRKEDSNFDRGYILLISAILHDIGMVSCKLPKVVESEILLEKDMTKRLRLINGAIEARLEHAKLGKEIAYDLLRIIPITWDIRHEICELILHHDDHKLARYGVFIKNNCDPKLLQLLREADSLWMLTGDGIDIDIKRSVKRGIIPFTVEGQFIHNLEIVKPIIKTDTGKEIMENLSKNINYYGRIKI